MGMINEHIRVTTEQEAQLSTLAENLGYSKSEVVRKMIDNVNEVTLQTIDEKNRMTDVELIATRKYLMHQLGGLTNNVNQLAKIANTMMKNDEGVNDDIANSLIQMVDVLTKQTEQLRGEINERGKSYR